MTNRAMLLAKILPSLQLCAGALQTLTLKRSVQEALGDGDKVRVLAELPKIALLLFDPGVETLCRRCQDGFQIIACIGQYLLLRPFQC